MTTIVDLRPTVIHLKVQRGDNQPLVFFLKDKTGAAIDITGWSIRFTVDPEENPTTNANNLFQIVGSIVDGPGGKFSVNRSLAQADQPPAIYWFDVQRVDPANTVRTLIKGQYEVDQDITKDTN